MIVQIHCYAKLSNYSLKKQGSNKSSKQSEEKINIFDAFLTV